MDLLMMKICWLILYDRDVLEGFSSHEICASAFMTRGSSYCGVKWLVYIVYFMHVLLCFFYNLLEQV